MACLVSLVVLEIGSAAWRGWMHRLPALPTTFEPSSPDEYRIVVLGGSSALGEPFRPWLSVGQIVAWQLQEAVPGRRFECEILAWLGDSLEKQHHKLAGSETPPGCRDHLLGAQRIRGAVREGESATPGSTRSPGNGCSARPIAPRWSRRSAGWPTRSSARTGWMSPPPLHGPTPAHRPAAVQAVGIGRHPGGLPRVGSRRSSHIANRSAHCRS